MAASAEKNIFKNLKGDIFGGITAGVIALPLALAFGIASGAGAAAGLYGAIFVGLFAALLGGTRLQVSGPTGPMTVVMASIIVMHPGNLPLIFFTIVLAGLFQIILGLFKTGDLIKYVPYPVISGFMSGIGTIIIILQLNPILGLHQSGNIIGSLKNTFTSLGMLNLHALTLGLVTLFIVFLTPKKINKIIPSSLLALILVTVISYVLHFNVSTIGNIPAALPMFRFPSVPIDLAMNMIPVALTLAILGAVDSLLTSLVADSITKTRHDSNRELIGQGIGNMVAGFFGGIAGAGATMRTVVNIKAGGKTRLSGVVHSLFLLGILLGAAPLAKHIPTAVLAGILIKVGFDIVDYKFLKVLKSAPKRDLFVMLWVYVITVFYDLIFAVGTGIVISAVLFAISVAQQFNVEVNGVCPLEDEGESEISKKSKYAIRILDINGILFFGSTSQVLDRVDDLLGTKHLIINCQNVTNLDISAVFALEDMILRTKDKGIKVYLVLNNENVTEKLKNLGILKVISAENIFYNKDKAIETVQSII